MIRRKVYQVTMISSAPDAPDEYRELQNRYWRAVEEQVRNLEARAGKVKRLFVEGIGYGGEEGLLRIRQTNEEAHRFAKSVVDAGAVLDAYENQELYEQLVDWSRIIQMGLFSETVANLARESFTAAGEKRLEHIKTHLDSAIGESEAAVIIGFNAAADVLPADVERFIVSPPELDEMQRLLRRLAEEAMRSAQMAQQDQPQSESNAEPGAQKDEGGSGLWVPGQS